MQIPVTGARSVWPAEDPAAANLGREPPRLAGAFPPDTTEASSACVQSATRSVDPADRLAPETEHENAAPSRLALAAILAFAGSIQAQASMRADADDVEVRIVDDRGRVLHQYPVFTDRREEIRRAYLEAKRGRSYSIRVSNHSGDRVGLVIAVDGRNVLSGEKSHVRPTERKYVLGPYQTAEYEGWRSTRDRVHRFYFTDAADSYAEAFDDRSALGVIAVAVYREKTSRSWEQDYDLIDGARSGKRSLRKGLDKSASEPGTGFGEAEWSPSRQVRFEPENEPVARHFLKYEWRKTLCRKGIVRCRDHGPPNRFWPEEEDAGFAPYPSDDKYSSLWGDRGKR